MCAHSRLHVAWQGNSDGMQIMSAAPFDE